jgi:hypothetical protein
MEFAALIPIFSSLIERFFPDPVQAAQAKLQMQQALNQAQSDKDKATADEMNAAGNVITTEMKGQNVLLANWRAILMLLIVAMIANQWIISPILIPILGFFHISYSVPTFPSEAWAMLTVGIGGYLGKEAVIEHHKGQANTAAIKAGAVPTAAPTVAAKLYFDAIRAVKGRALTQSEVDDGNKILSALNKV